MNQSQVETFLACLSKIDDQNLLALRTTQQHNLQDDHAHDHDPDHDHDHDHDHGTTVGNIMLAKATAMIVLFCASTLCGSIPFLLNRCFKWSERQDSARSAWLVQCLLYFGGGVLLATTFLHLLPEVQETVHQMEECNVLPALAFPLAELLMCTGFFLMYLIEESLHLYIRTNRKNLGLSDGAGAAFERGQSVRNSCLVKGNKQQQHQNVHQHHQHQNALDSVEVMQKLETSMNTVEENVDQSMPKTQNVSKYSNGHNHGHENGHSHGHENGHSHGHAHAHTHLPIAEADGMLTSSLRGLFVVLALSLHELFEGMAIGLETQSAAAVWFMFGAVSAHKLVLAFCVGVELIVARTRLFLAIIYVITFAIVSPIGIGIGMLLSSGTGNAAPSIPSAILQGMACGTLLYVVFFEILSKDHSGLRTYVALLFGFVIMFALQQIGTGGSHGHSHGGCSGGHNHDDHDHDHDHDHNHDEHSQRSHSHDVVDLKQRKLEEQLQLLRQASTTLGKHLRRK